MSEHLSEPAKTVDPSPPSDHHDKPRGAILIAIILGLAIVAVWFGLFMITAMRYEP